MKVREKKITGIIIILAPTATKNTTAGCIPEMIPYGIAPLSSEIGRTLNRITTMKFSAILF